MKFKSKHCEQEAKADGERITRMEKERDEDKHEAKVARLATSSACDTKARAEENLVRVQEALAPAGKSRRKADAEVSHLEIELTSLLLELKVTKDEMSSLHSQVRRDKETMEEEYQKALEEIFAYGYGCCVFKHNICGDHPEVPKGMPHSADPLPLEFFMSPGCLPVQAAAEAMATEAPLSEMPKEPMEVVAAED